MASDGVEASSNSNAAGAGKKTGRREFELAWIRKDGARRTTFRKRSKGIIKKMEELSTLCGIQGAAIIFGPNDAAPKVWPSVEGAADTLQRFYEMPEKDRTMKMMNQEKYLSDRIAKTTMKVEKVQRENAEAECTALMFRCIADMGRVQELDLPAMMSLAWMVDAKMLAVKDRIDALREQKKEKEQAMLTMQPSSVQPPLMLLPPMQPAVMPLQQPCIASLDEGDVIGGDDPPKSSIVAPLLGGGMEGYLTLPGVITGGGAASSSKNAAETID